MLNLYLLFGFSTCAFGSRWNGIWLVREDVSTLSQTTYHLFPPLASDILTYGLDMYSSTIVVVILDGSLAGISLAVKSVRTPTYERVEKCQENTII